MPTPTALDSEFYPNIMPGKVGMKRLFKQFYHKQFICWYGDDMPEITGWRWGGQAASVAVRSTEAD